MRAELAFSLLLLGALACTQEPLTGSLPSVPPDPTNPGTLPPARPGAVAVDVHHEGHAGLTPPAPAPEDAFRNRRRMDLEQLDAAIRRVTGGIGWTERRNNVDVNLLEELASTLGRPDFLQVVDEDLEPSAMFQKFLDDAARSVCDRLVTVDMSRPEAERTFFVAATPASSWATDAGAVSANLRALLLTFHGRRVAEGAPELEPWTWLVQSAEHVAPREPAQVWRTVCVGLMTHPDFYTY